MIIGRNEECPCGSGKKYKKCCLNKVISMDEIISKELNQLQEQLYEFFEKKNPEPFYAILDNYFPEDELTEEEGILLTTLLILWATMEKPFMSKTLAEQFIEEKRAGKKLRPAVMSQLEKWGTVSPSYSIITKLTDGNWMEVEDFATKEMKKVKVFENAPKLEVGMSLLGFLLPYGTYYSYFLFPLHFDEEDGEVLAEFLSDLYAESEFKDFSEFMSNEFPYILNWILFESNEIDDMHWEDPYYLEVVDIYGEMAVEDPKFSVQLLELGAVMWNIYCLKQKPIIRKPEIYAAALHYFIDINIPGLALFTQKDLAERYGVSVASLSKAFRQMETTLSDELEKLEKSSIKDMMLDQARANSNKGNSTVRFTEDKTK